MESYRPKRSVVKKVLTYNINYHQIGYYEQRELQKALKNSLLEAEEASKKDNDLIDNKTNDLNELTTTSNLDLLNNDKQSTDLTTEPNNQFKQSINNIIDQILNQPFEEDLPIDKNENSSFKVNTKEINGLPTKKLKLDKKSSSIKTKRTKNDKLEFNYKDKFKNLDKFDNELLIKLKDVEKEFKKCKDKLINDQVTNVFNSDKKGDLNDLQINLTNKQDIDLDDQLDDNFDLNNLISSLIDKLDENNSIDSSDEFKSTSNELFNHNLNNQSLDNELIMVSNKNSSSLSNSIKIKKELNDKNLLNNHKTSSNKTNGNTNGHHLIDDDLESQFNSTNKKKNKKLKKDKNVNNKKSRKAKSNVSSLLDFHFEFDDHDNKSTKDDLFSLNSFDDLSSKQECTNSYSSSSSSSSTSIKSTSNKSTTSSSKSNKSTTNKLTNTLNNKSTTKKPTKPKSKLFTIRNSIKNEIRQKLLHKSMLLAKNKISTKNNDHLTNGIDKSKKKSNGQFKSSTKLNGTTKTETNGLSSSKFNDLLSPNKIETNGKLKKQKKKDLELTSTKSNKKLKKDDKTTPIKNRKPRTPHLIKEPKRRRRSKELIRRSNLLIRNLYKFRQYLKFKKQELLNLDRDELTALNVISKDLMYCFIDNSNNFEIDCDIYDPLTVSGLLDFKNSNSILSDDLLLDNLLPNLTDDKPKTNGYHELNFDSTTEEDDNSEVWTSAPSSPI